MPFSTLQLLVITCLARQTTQFTAPFTAPYTPPFTTPPMATTPGVPPGGCRYGGIVYMNGESIKKDPDGCYGTICSSGNPTAWDHKCFFYTPECSGIQRKISGQCCPECLSTTIPPTTPPTTRFPTTFLTTVPLPPNACVVDQKIYQSGEKIHEDSNHCGGTMCQYGQVTYWDHHCMFYTPACAGISYPVPGQCCPGCNLTTTTTYPTPTPTYPTTTTTYPTTTPTYPTTTVANRTTSTNTTTKIPQNGCLYIGQVYNNYDKLNISPDGCHGHECHHGVVRPWKYPCLPAARCTGTLVNVTGQCCPRCVPTTTAATNATGPPTLDTCNISGKIYTKGAVTKTDVCNVCRCGDAGQEDCTQVQCPVLDCEGEQMRYQNDCCFTCGTSSVTLAWWTLVLTTGAALYWV